MTPVRRNNENPFEIQCEASKYYEAGYLTPQRFSSIGFQYRACLSFDALTYIDIGSGNNILAYILSKNRKRVFTIDHNPGIKAEIVSLLPYLPIADKAVDVSLCFQVLEHLPFSLFETSLREMKRVSRRGLIISLPEQANYVPKKVSLKRKIKNLLGFQKRCNDYPPGSRDKEHFWELGIDLEYSTIIDIASHNGLYLMEHFVNPYFTYHHFFLFSIDSE
jgi:hypothetical protein